MQTPPQPATLTPPLRANVTPTQNSPHTDSTMPAWANVLARAILQGAQTASQPSVPTTSATLSSFAPWELRKLHLLCGSEIDLDNPTAGLFEFWLNFVPYRRSVQLSRGYIENVFNDNPTGQNFIWLSQGISDLRNLFLYPNEQEDGWLARRRGISFWLTAPLRDDADTASIRARMTSYEDTMDQHTPKERKELFNAKATNDAEDYPHDRRELKEWVCHHYEVTLILFGSAAPILPVLLNLEKTLARPPTPNYFSLPLVLTSAWCIHRGIRTYYRTGSIHKLDNTVQLLLQESLVANSLPAELRAIIARHTTPTLAPLPKHLLGTQPNQPANRRRQVPASPATPAAPPQRQAVGAPYSNRFQPDVERARQAVTAAGGTFRLKLLANGNEAVTALFGNVFPIADGRGPCMRYFFQGRCSGQCSLVHNVTSSPTDAMLAGIQRRLKARCDHLVAHPLNP